MTDTLKCELLIQNEPTEILLFCLEKVKLMRNYVKF